MTKCYLIWIVGKQTRQSLNNISHPDRERWEEEEKEVVVFTLMN